MLPFKVANVTFAQNCNISKYLRIKQQNHHRNWHKISIVKMEVAVITSHCGSFFIHYNLTCTSQMKRIKLLQYFVAIKTNHFND